MVSRSVVSQYKPTGGRTARLDWIALVGEIVRLAPKLGGAACTGYGAMFDGDHPPGSVQVRMATELCQRCPALADCRRWFESLPNNRRPYGVVAGRHRRRIPRPLTPRPDDGAEQ